MPADQAVGPWDRQIGELYGLTDANQWIEGKRSFGIREYFYRLGNRIGATAL